jgi:hypothetical protein
VDVFIVPFVLFVILCLCLLFSPYPSKLFLSFNPRTFHLSFNSLSFLLELRLFYILEFTLTLELTYTRGVDMVSHMSVSHLTLV